MTNYYNAKLFLKNNNTFKEMHPKPIKKENFEGKKVGLTKRKETNNEIKVPTLNLNRTATYFFISEVRKEKGNMRSEANK